MNYHKKENIILGNRYELISKIGGGGMAFVFKAKCKLLNRFVAVKVLKDEYTSDEEFVKRFLVEAQSAASLSHPNIVPIYDVGKDENVHYIVMEYVDGKTLKEYIEEKGVLDWREATDIAIQICLAIDHAHRNHIIHRDIKPHNILTTKEGVVKVTDFGIARAATATTITMAGTTIGSVHYISPEQARGFITDEKSDIYSLGIVLYEMVVGKVPFNGESPIAVALKHIQNELVSPRELNMNIPIGINSIIVNTVKKEKDKRYKSASELLIDLQAVKNDPNREFVVMQNVAVNNAATIRVPAVKSSILNYDNNETQEEKKGKLPFWLGISTAAFIIVLILSFSFIKLFPFLGITGAESNNGYVVENYVGRNYDEVKIELEEKNIEVQENKRRYDDKAPKNVILSQSRLKGEKIKEGKNNIIYFEVSDGVEQIKIPNLRNNDYRQAEMKLMEIGLEPIITEEYSNDIGVGLVIKTDPEQGSEVAKNSNVKIYKSKGVEIKMVTVPNLVGKTKVDAIKILEGAKLILGNITPSDLTNVKDNIVSQEPATGYAVKEGTPVNIVFEQNKIRRKLVKETLNLNEPEKYGDKINVFIEVTPSDTNLAEILMNTQKDKIAFPLAFKVSVPVNGNTKVRVYLDKMLYTEFIEY